MSYFNEHQNEAFLENVFRANGMSFSNLIKNNGEEYIQASQRVEFRVDPVNQILDSLETYSKGKLVMRLMF